MAFYYSNLHHGLIKAVVIFLTCVFTSALYADEAGKIDYTVSTAGHGNLGVQYAHLISGGTAILTSSSEPDLPGNQMGGCYLSSRDLRSGKLLWRRDVCSARDARYAVCAASYSGTSDSTNALVYTLDNRGVMRAWDESTGQLIHDHRIPENYPTFDDYDSVNPRFLGCYDHYSVIAAVLSRPNHGEQIFFIGSKRFSLEAESILKSAKVTGKDHESLARFLHLSEARNTAISTTNLAAHFLVTAFVQSKDTPYTTIGEMSYVHLSLSTTEDKLASNPFCRDPRSNAANIPISTSSIKFIENKNGAWSVFGLSVDGTKIVSCVTDEVGSITTVTSLSNLWSRIDALDIVSHYPPLIRVTGRQVDQSSPTVLSSGLWSLPDLIQGKSIAPDKLFDQVVQCEQTLISFSSDTHEKYPNSPTTTVKVVQLLSNISPEVIEIHDGPVNHIHLLECSKNEMKLLATTKSGGSYVLSYNDARHGKLQLHWTAEEAMANVSSSLFLDMSQSIAKHMDATDETEETVMDSLSFPSRMATQFESLKKFLNGGFVNHFLSLMNKMPMKQHLSQLDSNEYKFGFAKISVLLSQSYSKLMGTDTLAKGQLLWSLNLNPTALWHKLVHGSLTSRSSVYGIGYYQPHSHEILLLSSFPGRIEWSCVDMFRGRVLSQSSVQVTSPVIEVFPLYGVTSDCRQGAIILHEDKSVTVVPGLNETLLNNSKTVSDGVYMAHVDNGSGRFTSYYSSFQSDSKYGQRFSRAIVVGEIVFDASAETIISWTFPEKNEIIQSPASILGDDSLLLKYLNPHICVIVTEVTVSSFESLVSASVNSTSKEFYQAFVAKAGKTTDGKQKKPLGATNPGEELHPMDEKTEPPPTLFVNIVDTVSGQVLHRVSHTHADQKSLAKKDMHVPVVVSENWIIYAFPNYRSRRTEIGVLTMHEGMIDKNGLTAFKRPEQEDTFSSMTSAKPIVLGKTFGFSKPISAIGVTHTKGGISAKNVLFATGISGQVIRVDRRMLDPRRPVGEPKKSEKEEGLMQYAPIVPIISQWIVSYSNMIQAVTSIVSSAANLESHTLMMAYGGPDIFFTRLAPSKGFDSLPETFNRILLLVIMMSLLIAIRVIFAKSKRKLVAVGWV